VPLALLPSCKSQSACTSPWLCDAHVLVQGGGVDEPDCRTQICRHNENTDLIAWRGAIYLVHRTAQSQVLGPNSSLRISRSDDGGAHFTLLSIIPAPMGDPLLGDRDLRDPSFYIVGDELYLKALVRLPVTSARDADVDTRSVLSHTKDGVTWTSFTDVSGGGWSFWRVKPGPSGYFSAAYEDGDKSVVLYSSSDGKIWNKGALIYGVAADTPLETELTFLPSGRLLALVRMDGTDDELAGQAGRLRTKVCWAQPPYEHFDCPQELTGQRLDGPVSFFWKERLFVVARKHLPTDDLKRTALFELGGTLEGGPLTIKEWGELPSAGDTSYAGVAPIGDTHVLCAWYSTPLAFDEPWVVALLDASDIWQATFALDSLR